MVDQIGADDHAKASRPMIWVRKLGAALDRRCVTVPVTVVCAAAVLVGGVVVAGRTEGGSMLASLALVYAYMQLFMVPRR